MRFLFPIFIIILAGLIFFGLAMPMYYGSDNSYLKQYLLHGSGKGIKTLVLERASLKEGLKTTAELQKISKDLEQRINSIKDSDLIRLDRYLPDNIDNVQLILDVNSIALQSGMQIKNIKIETVADKVSKALPPAKATSQDPTVGGLDHQISTLRMSFSTAGSYNNFLNFLDNLSHSLRLLDVEEISFQSVNAQTTTPAQSKDFYQYNLKIKTYWLQ